MSHFEAQVFHFDVGNRDSCCRSADVTGGSAASRDDQRRAFTLVELLVVLAIIGLLTAIVISALASARSDSHRSACSSNLHQVVMAMHLYQEDWGAPYPYHQVESVSDWAPLAPYTHSQTVVRCPYPANSLPDTWFYAYVGMPHLEYPKPAYGPPNMDNGMVVVFCGQHLRWDYPDSVNTHAGTYVAARGDGSAKSYPAQTVTEWVYERGEWIPEQNATLRGHFGMARFPGDPWPPSSD